MNNFHFSFLPILSSVSLLVSIFGAYQIHDKRKQFTETKLLSIVGIFVWADAPIIGLFWALVSAISIYSNSTRIFIILFFLFWIVRSQGEVVYWLNEQFAQTKRNKPECLLGNRFCKGESIYIMYQLYWQCVCVFSLFGLLYSLGLLDKIS